MQAQADSVGQRGEVFSLTGAHQNVAASFWQWLGQQDHHIRPPAPDTIGSMCGDRLRVQWWTDPTGAWFAAQVVDMTSRSLWEVFLVPARSGQPVAGRRLFMGDASAIELLDTLWLEVFGPQVGTQVDEARYPAFAELVAAGCNPSGVTTVRDDAALVARLEADVAYWKHLAVSLSKTALTRESTYTPPPPADAPPAASGSAPVARKWGLKDIAEYAEANAHRITILQRAVSATKRSSFENPDLLYTCLELLASEYTEVKTGKADRNAFKVKAEALGIDFGGSVDPSVAGELGDLYFIRLGGRRRFLDQHLGKGSARDPRYCMRIYFCWDEDTNRVVIGHMPSHLPTSYT